MDLSEFVLKLFFFLLIFMVVPQYTYGSRRHRIRASVTTEGICTSAVVIHGYQCQEFEVKTQDGYLLNIQRISKGQLAKKQPVLIHHGILVDGMAWLLNSPEQNLPMILADQGFDVWLANMRGTKFSRKHILLNPSQKEFWNWSWDELAEYDLPAIFNHVYSQTGQKIHYIGHSLGTLIGLASLSQGKLVDKMKSSAFLCPVAYLNHITTPLGAVASRVFLAELIQALGFSEFNPKSKEVAYILKSVCIKGGVDCYDFMSLITGENCCLNATTIEIFLKNEPQSTSVKNLIHLSQSVRDGVVKKYNYGSINSNMKHYGQSQPPIYNLSSIPIDMPIFVSHGGKDALSDPKDVEILLNTFKSHQEDKLHVHYIKDYAHADFIMAVNAKSVVYNEVVSFFKGIY